MTFVRVTRDQRGYETTSLLHTPRPGASARLLYHYRSAPELRVGRIALDEEAIRTIEAQHPDIDFDWPQLLEDLRTTVPDVDPPVERRRRPTRPRSHEALEAPLAEVDGPPSPTPPQSSPRVTESPSQPTLLDQLVGREIAQQLRMRYHEMASRIAERAENAGFRPEWQQRAEALDPDRWATPEAILSGVQNADRLFEQLRRDVIGG